MIRVPTEVIKTRTQTSTYGPSVTSSWASAKQVLKTDGFAGFYRGFFTTIIREVCTDWHNFPPFLQYPVYECRIIDTLHLDTVPFV